MNKILIILLSFSITAKAQSYIEKSGANVDNKDTPNFSYAIGSDDKYLYTLWNDESLMNRHPTYNIIQTNKISLNSEKKVATLTLEKFCQLSFVTKVKDKFFLFTKNLNSDHDKWQFIVNECSSSANKSTKLIEFDTDKNSFQRTAFRCRMSADSSKIAIISYHMGNVEFNLYEAYTLRKIGSAKLPASEDLNSFYKTQYIIDNEGNLFYIDNHFQP